MSPQWPEDTSQRRQRPDHLSVTSLYTNASTLADSTISFGSTWTGDNGEDRLRFSHFPQPPATLPDASLRSEFDTPPHTPRQDTFDRSSLTSTPRAAVFPNFVFGSPRPKIAIQTTAPLVARAKNSSGAQNLVSPQFVSSPSSGLPESSDHSTLRDEPRFPERAPYSPASKQRGGPSAKPLSSAASAVSYDWNDGSSVVSVNSREERLLSTSFITSLLTEVVDHQGNSYNAWERATETVENSGTRDLNSKLSLSSPQRQPGRERNDHSEHDAPVYSSFPQHTRSTSSSAPPLYSPDHSQPSPSAGHPPKSLFPGHQTSAQEVVRDDPRATVISPRPSAEYSDMTHSEEVIQSAVRTTALSWSRNASGPSIVGVAPAYTLRSLPSVRSTVNADGLPSVPAPTPPPPHMPDMPQSVTDYTHTSSEGIEQLDREYQQMFLKTGDYSGEQVPYSPALASTAGTYNNFDDVLRVRPSPRRRKSAHSTKSFVSSLMSHISIRGPVSIPKMAWLHQRPLPPLPRALNVPHGVPYDEETRKYEEGIPLPQLMKRAGVLEHRLDPANHSVITEGSLYGPEKRLIRSDFASYASSYDAHGKSSQLEVSDNKLTHSTRGPWSRLRNRHKSEGGTHTLHSPVAKIKPFRTKKVRVIICAVVSVVLVVVGITAGLLLSKKKGHPLLQCQGNSTGAACDLDATCVCTSSLPGQCDQLAQALLNLIPTVNSVFTANFTPSSLSNQIWNAQGSPVGDLCTKQALLVDVAPGLDKSISPNRTQWAQAALLWNLALSADLTATSNLQSFVAQARWSSLNSTDGPIADPSTAFSTTESGYVFDFASQTVTPPSISFQNSGQASDAQIAKISHTAGQVLDRMYSFASASSTQRQKSLTNYWQTVLQQQATDLPKFMSIVNSAPFLLPFDATSSLGGQNMADLLTNSSTAAFPPPLACYPSLDESQLQRLNAVETTVFGLSSAVSASQFDASCFPDRPIYGVVDLLQLRLPFNDNRTGVAKQAATLNMAVIPRAVIYSGELLSALPGASSVPDITAAAIEPREYGMKDHMNHVILNYLSSFVNISLATELVQYMLQNTTVPPPPASSLFNTLSSVPILEFALFGSVSPPDIASSVSSFSTPSGSLFFGSPQAQSFRTWALIEPSSSVIWAESSSSPEVVRENPTTDSVFESVWNPASELIQSGVATPSDVGNVTRAFEAVGKFSP